MTNAATKPLPVLYKELVPLTKEQHRGLKLDRDEKPLGFTAGVNAVPALVEEFFVAARELPVVFVPEGDTINAVFLLGLRPNSNSFLSDEGLWTASYIPAYIRRYPFMLGEVPGREPILCFDPAFKGFNEAKGEALFGADGEPTEFLRDALDFAANFRVAAERTTSFVSKLKSFDLFRTVSLDVKSPKLGDVKIDGVLIVDEEKLRKLSDSQTLDLAKSGALRQIHAHLFSLSTVSALQG